MPPITKITKDEIIKSSVEIIKADGIGALNARGIAKKLNCSTQPLFYHFENMDDIKNESTKYISNIFNEFIFQSNYDKPVYKDIGKNYIRFAREYPQFFYLLFNSDYKGEVNEFIELTGDSETIFKTISKQTGLSIDDAKKFHLKMWLYVNGIANLVANNTINFSDSEIEVLLGEQYLSMILLGIKKGKIDESVFDNTIKNNLKERGVYDEK